MKFIHFHVTNFTVCLSFRTLSPFFSLIFSSSMDSIGKHSDNCLSFQILLLELLVSIHNIMILINFFVAGILDIVSVSFNRPLILFLDQSCIDLFCVVALSCSLSFFALPRSFRSLFYSFIRVLALLHVANISNSVQFAQKCCQMDSNNENIFTRTYR